MIHDTSLVKFNVAVAGFLMLSPLFLSGLVAHNHKEQEETTTRRKHCGLEWRPREPRLMNLVSGVAE